MSARDLLRAEFEDRTIIAIPAVPLEIENIEFDQPKTEMYASCWLMFAASTRASVGTVRRFNRHTGFWCVDLYQPESAQGVKVMWEAAALLEASFEALGFALADAGYVVTMVPKVVNGPIREGYVTKTLMVPFYLDACSP